MQKEDEYFRSRMFAVAMAHLDDQPITHRVYVRYQLNDAWHGEPGESNFAALESQVLQSDYVLPNGPLIPIMEKETAIVTDLADLFTMQSKRLREFACRVLENIRALSSTNVADITLSILNRNRLLLLSDDQDEWLSAGASIAEAVSNDFRINCLGAKQSDLMGYQDGFNLFLNRALHPRLVSFEHDLPAMHNPLKQAKEIDERIMLFASRERIEDALDEYIEYCGYVPLCGKRSASYVIGVWKNNFPHESIDSNRLIAWSNGHVSCVAKYHLLQYYLNQESLSETEQLEVRQCLEGILRHPSFDSPDEFGWAVRAILVKHFQQHFESLRPMLDSEVIAVTACWAAEKVSRLVSRIGRSDIKNVSSIAKNVLPRSSLRWTIGRSSMTASSLRSACLFSPFFWCSAVLQTVLRKCAREDRGLQSIHDKCLDALMRELLLGGVVTRRREREVYAFEEFVELSEVEECLLGGDDKEKRCIELLRCFDYISGISNFKEFCNSLSEILPSVQDVALWRKVMEVYGINSMFESIGEVLADDAERRGVLLSLESDSLRPYCELLIQWQLLQGEEWQHRLPRLLASDFGVCRIDSRTEFLSYIKESALSSETGSALLTLLESDFRGEVLATVRAWIGHDMEAARSSEEWISSRLRRVYGIIQPLL